MLTVRKKHYDKASEWVDKTLSIQPDYPRAHNQRGLIAQEQKQYDRAIAAFEKAHELDPSEADFAYNIGWSLLEELKYPESEKWAQKAIKLNSIHVGAQNLVGVIAFSQRCWGEAAQIFRRAAAAAPSEPMLPCNLASAYMRLGRFAEAHEQISVALQIDREHPEAHRLLAILHHLTDSPEAAQLALNLEQDFSSLLVFALTRPRSITSRKPDDALQVLKRALDSASQLDREQEFDFVIYALCVLQTVHGGQAVRAVVLGNTSPVWESFRQAITHLEQIGSPPQDPRVAAIVASLSSQLPPREQLLAAWAAGQPIVS